MFASDQPGYGSGWYAFHNGERYEAGYLSILASSADHGSPGFARGYRAASAGLGLYDEIYN